jgi:SAM-dependent methyltransferase
VSNSRVESDLGAAHNGTPDPLLNPLIALVRCLECRSEVRSAQPDRTVAESAVRASAIRCIGCGRVYLVTGGTLRMLPDELASAMPIGAPPLTPDVRSHGSRQATLRTARSFAYEWRHFGVLRPEWRKNFLAYMQPHPPEFFRGSVVLDVGAGSGRHSFHAAQLGAQVVAVDVGPAIDVARRNLPPSVLTMQADAEHLPLEPASFDLVAAIGVLHHLEDPERCFRSLVEYVKPGGWIQIYVYWQPPRAAHRALLRAVTALRRVTTKLPHPVMHALSYPAAAAAYAGAVLPIRLLRRFELTNRLASVFPLQAYADYPFAVCVNDQFDRFSAPIEHRFEAADVRRWFREAGLESVQVLANNGWVGTGQRPIPINRRAR